MWQRYYLLLPNSPNKGGNIAAYSLWMSCIKLKSWNNKSKQILAFKLMISYWSASDVMKWYAGTVQRPDFMWSSWGVITPSHTTQRIMMWLCLFTCVLVWRREKRRLTGAHVLWFVHVSTVIAVPTTAEGGGLDGGATVERTLLT